MDTDALRPRCPYCAGDMQFTRTSPNFGAHSALQIFECSGCCVTLTVPPGAEAFEMAAFSGNG
jgi:transposase-like protein